MSVATTNNNAINTIYSQNAEEQIKKDEKKQAEMLAALIGVLDDVISTVASSESGAPNTSAKKLGSDSKKLSDAVKGKEGGHRNSQHPYQPHAPIAKSSPSLTTLYPSSQAMA